MSLLDALLLEGPRPKLTAPGQEVWGAVRTDGIRGSGTITDPFDASLKVGPSISVTLSLVSTTQFRASSGSTDHGYANYDIIVISGVTGDHAAFYNGVFQISNVSHGAEHTFEFTLFADPGGNPEGSPTARKDIFQFDELMKLMPGNTAIHLGPGIFPTRGSAEGMQNPGWTPKSGQKIRGSGIGVTVLRLEYACLKDRLFSAIGSPYDATLDTFEANDFTVDCNLPNQPANGLPVAPVGCAGIAIRRSGGHVRLRRIHCIHFGTQTGAAECFAMVPASAHPSSQPPPVNGVMEDCILEHPSENNFRETTCYNLGSSENGDGVMAYHVACSIRQCYADLEYKAMAVPVEQALSMVVRRPFFRMGVLRPHTVFQRVVIRGNIAQSEAGTTNPAPWPPLMLELQSVENGVVSNNISFLPSSVDPVRYRYSHRLTFFQNERSSGELTRGFEPFLFEHSDELGTLIDDVFAATFI